MTWYR